MNLKPDLTVSTSKAKLAGENVVLRCGECMHFKGSPHPSIGTPCSSQGVRPFATAPNCYTPDVHQLKAVSVDSMVMLSNFVSSCKPSQAKILMGLLKNQAQLKRFDLAFMQKVYFALGKGDYLTEYFSGFALGVAPQNKILIVGSQYWGNARNAVVAQLDAKSVLVRDDFSKLVKRLQKQGRLSPPRVNPPRFVSNDADKYEPPTIETAQELLEATADGSKFKKRKALQGKKVLRIGGPQTEEV
jgi:hypothetical protein